MTKRSEQQIITEELSQHNIELLYSAKWDVHEEFRFLVNDGKTYEFYYVSNLGRIYSVKQHKIMTTNLQGHYLQAHLVLENGKQLYYLVSRVVAFTFIPNVDPINKTCVNHLDEFQKTDNCYLNLCWASISENLRYGTCQERRANKIRKPVVQYDADGNITAKFLSLSDTASAFNTYPSTLCKCIYDNKPFKGYYFKYAA